MDNKTIVVALGGVVFAIGLVMFVLAFQTTANNFNPSPVVDLFVSIVGALPTSYHPGLVLMAIGGLVMYFGSREG